MSAVRRPAKVAGNRQSAYIARKRSDLLNSGREILMQCGPSATIDEIISHARVSPTTIYKYFESKENFLAIAQISLWKEWEAWALNASLEISDPLERFINPIRLLIRVSATHPQLAQSLEHSTTKPDFIIQHLSSGSEKIVKDLAKARLISSDNTEARYLLFSHAVIAIIKRALGGSNSRFTECEKMLAVALGLLGISESKALKVVSRKLFIPETASK